MTLSVIAAETRRDLNVVLINEQGPFVRPRMSIDGIHFNYGLRDADARSLLLLHELGHLVGRFKPDGDNSELSGMYSRLVWQSCFQ